MRLRPASWQWLLRHELRLVWRNVGGARLTILIVLGGLLWLALHYVIWLLLRVVGDPASLPPGTYLLAGSTLWVVFTLMLSQAILLSVNTFFDRGDLDLVLSSPLPPRNVFIVRGLGVAVAATSLYALLLTPFAHVGLVTGKLRLLAVYPALAALGLLAATIGMGSTIALVRLLGARRARTAAQLLGALVGAAFFLVIQVNNVVSHERTARWMISLWKAAREDGPLGPASPLWLPFDAMLGQPLALAALVAVGTGSFLLVVASMARRFLDGTQESVTTPAPRQTDAAIAAARFHGSPWRVVLVKEWKLIGRDPQLIANTLLQMLYLLPMMFVWAGQTSAETVMLPALVFAASTLAGGMVWLTVAAEDAPELLAAAPVETGLLSRAKLVAALLPIWILLSPVPMFLLASRPLAALLFAFCLAGSTISVGVVQLAMPQRGSRRDMRRRAKGNAAGGVMELVTMAGWAALTWCLLRAPVYAALAAVPAVAGPLTAWLFGGARRRAFAGG